MSQAPDGAFYLHTPEVALLELKPEVPPGPFRLEAEIRHEDGEEGEAGLVLGLHQNRTGKEARHAFWDVIFTDRGRVKNQLGLHLSSCPVGSPQALSQALFSGPHRLQSPQPSGWRAVVVEQTAEDLRVSCDGQQLVQLSRSRLREYAEMSRRGAPAMGTAYAPEGGLGLYLYRGGASFRNVIVTSEP